MATGADIDPASITIPEFAEMFALGYNSAGRRLRALVESGKAKRAQKWTTGVDGRRILVSSYRLV
jgi:hypothetical protein